MYNMRILFPVYSYFNKIEMIVNADQTGQTFASDKAGAERVVADVFAPQMEQIVTLSQFIDRRCIEAEGLAYFPFATRVESGVDAMTEVHAENIARLCAGAKNHEEAGAISKDALEVVASTEISPVDRFQTVLRLQEQARALSVQLVGIDVSRTIVEYVSDAESEANGDKRVIEYLVSVGKGVRPGGFSSAMKIAFRRYAKWREKTQVEIPETQFYRDYLLPELGIDLTTEQIVEVAKIWRKSSVRLSLVAKRIAELVEQLKSRGIKVVTVSDMLGPMTEFALCRLGIERIFDGHFTSSRYGARKRSSVSLFTHAAEVVGVSPLNALFIGNDAIDDIRGSADAGWRAQIFLHFSDDSSSVVSDFQARDLDQLLEALLRGEIPLLPSTARTLFYPGMTPARRVDDDQTKVSYAIRAIAMNLPDRRIREEVYRRHLAFHIGQGTRLGNRVEIRYPGRIFIGDNCQVNDDVALHNEAPIVVGDNVMIARGVYVCTYDHDWRLGMLQDGTPSWQKGNTEVKPVSIESNVWIGPNATICAGAYVGHHSVIGANSLVQGGVIPPYSFVAGNPARVVRSIRYDLENKRKSFYFGMS